ncbi:MAG: hypothetical protein K8R25_11120, partial [Methanosarcinales archaeon]|nr:hypothetical protein [Methanosarcinales archaeon]
GIQSFLAHASGHASADEIKKMVEMINPQYLIPIHTQHPELFYSISKLFSNSKSEEKEDGLRL